MSEQIATQYPDDWSRLTSEQKREWRFARWRESAQRIPFVDGEADAAYTARLERLIAVYNVEEPDRVPLSPAMGSLPLREAGLDNHTAIYHPEKAVEAVMAFNRKHADELDCFAATGYTTIPARALDLLECKMYAHPGHGMPEDAAGFQFIESEYMQDDEYNALLRDPSDFWLRTYFPRVYGVFAPLRQLDPLTDVVEMIQMPLWPLARPDIQALLQRLLDVGKELAGYQEIMDREAGQAEAHGHLSTFPAAFAKAPYDTIGDTLRGTRGVLMDMLRKPDELLEALDAVADLTISSVLDSPAAQGAVGAWFPLHKGADGWMSEEQFLTFYWPSLKKVIDAFVAEGMLVRLFAEGSYNTRLDLVGGFPKGAIAWHFDRTDMAKAKRILGADCSLQGNIPSSLLVAASPEEVTAECQRLIDICAPGGGYILGAGAIPEFPKLENLRAMATAAREYGVYSRSRLLNNETPATRTHWTAR